MGARGAYGVEGEGSIGALGLAEVAGENDLGAVLNEELGMEGCDGCVP